MSASPRRSADLERELGALADQDLSQASEEEITELLAGMVAHPDYPCLGARSVFRRDAATVVVLDSMESPEDLARLAEELRAFAAAHGDSADLVSFLAVFRSPAIVTEERFEALLWGVLQHLHDRDDRAWAPGVSDDTARPDFAFSYAGTAYFIVGMHPGASRIARRTPLPTLVFNLHEQFERLRADGTFDRMRTAIRRRDARLQGTANPMAADHRTSSEARQYSGRVVGAHWHAPFISEETPP